jgi:hypothetical protein
MTISYTSRLKLPTPQANQSADVPADLLALATALDKAAVIDVGPVANRPTSTPGTPGIAGRFYFATDEVLLYHDNGTGWNSIGPSVIADLAVTTAKLADLAVTRPKIANGAIADLQVSGTAAINASKLLSGSVAALQISDALKPSAGASAATESLRALGTSAGQALPGNDARLLNATPAIVTTLPSTPVDGQECYYVADAANGVVWHLRYRTAAVGAYKWEYLGGAPLAYSYYPTSNYNAPGAPGANDTNCTVTPPLAGDYIVDFGVTANMGTANNSIAFSVYNNSVRSDSSFIQGLPATAYTVLARRLRMNALAAATVLYLNYIAANGGVVTVYARSLAITPVRVG